MGSSRSSVSHVLLPFHTFALGVPGEIYMPSCVEGIRRVYHVVGALSLCRAISIIYGL